MVGRQIDKVELTEKFQSFVLPLLAGFGICDSESFRGLFGGSSANCPVSQITKFNFELQNLSFWIQNLFLHLQHVLGRCTPWFHLYLSSEKWVSKESQLSNHSKFRNPCCLSQEVKGYVRTLQPNLLNGQTSMFVCLCFFSEAQRAEKIKVWLSPLAQILDV